MKQIVTPTNVALKILGNQGYNPSLKYRPILFHHSVEIDDGLLIINFLTSELLFLDNFEKYLFQTGKYNELSRDLIANWFLVPTNTDDNSLFENYQKILDILVSSNENSKDFIDTYTILPTTDCNARCFYCFELDRKRIAMTEKVAYDIAEYIIKNSKGHNVRLRWFGGEPLYNIKVIDIISSELKKNNVCYASYMVTNGYLFDAKIINKAVTNWNLKRVQVTLDGTEKVYNRCKAFIYKDTNAFEIVTNNIEELLKAGIYVNIRMNMDIHNEQDLYDLSDYIADRYSKYEDFSAYPHLLYDNTGSFKSDDFDKKEMLYNKFLALEKYMQNKNIFKFGLIDGKVRIGGCMANKANTVIITPEGNLGKCEYYTDSKFFGSIYSDKIKYDVINELKYRRKIFSDCKNCSYRPFCIQNESCPSAAKYCGEAERKFTLANFENFMKNTYKNYSHGIKVKYGPI